MDRQMLAHSWREIGDRSVRHGGRRHLRGRVGSCFVASQRAYQRHHGGNQKLAAGDAERIVQEAADRIADTANVGLQRASSARREPSSSKVRRSPVSMLISYRVIVDLINASTTGAGLEVHCELDANVWNYTIKPVSRSDRAVGS
jgi:hypothetical protein